MEVENKWFSLLVVDGAEGITGEPIGKQAKIAAAGNRHFFTQQEGCGNRIFEQTIAMAVGKAWRGGNAVGIVADGKNRGVVGEAEFLEDVDSPHGFAGDGIAGGAIAEDRFTDDVLDRKSVV